MSYHLGMIQQKDERGLLKKIQQDPLFQLAELLIAIDKREQIAVIKECEDEADQ